jgi:AcrR family transcriptional regulator
MSSGYRVKRGKKLPEKLSERKSASAPKKRNATKGARTRAKIKQYAHKLFAENGHIGVTAQSIVETAGVSSGTFYVYFSNKDEVISEICQDFMDKMIGTLAEVRESDSDFEYLYIGQYIFVKYVYENYGFFRALIEYSYANSNIFKILHDARIREAKRTAQLFMRWSELGRFVPTNDAKGSFRAAMALNAMTEGFVQDELTTLGPDTSLTDRQLRDLAMLVSRLFYRAVFLEEPPVIDFDRA